MTDAQHDDTAGAHAWTDQISRIRFGTQPALGKNVAGARIKAVAERMARYATHATGADVRPGLARIAVDLEMDYRTVKAAVAVLVRTGLLRLARPASRPGDADDYQLVIPTDLLDRTDIEVWSPARHLLEMEKVREKVRGKYKRPDVRGPDGPQGQEPAGATGTAEPVDNHRPAGAGRAADADSTETPAGATKAADLEPAGATRANLRPLRPLPPPSDRVPNYDLPTSEEVRTDVTGPRADRPEDPDSDVVDQETPASPLRVIAGNPDAQPTRRGIWPALVAHDGDQEQPAAPAEGYGFCLPCHAQGQITVAADPANGSRCAFHLRSAS